MPQRSYKHLVRWMNANVEERMTLAKELAQYINFNGFPIRALIDISNDSLFDSNAILELLRSKKNEEIALATLTPEERKFHLVITHNAIYEFEFCGLQWYFLTFYGNYEILKIPPFRKKYSFNLKFYFFLFSRYVRPIVSTKANTLIKVVILLAYY